MNNGKKFVLSSFLLLALVFSSFRSVQTVHAACSGVVYVNANSGAASPDGCSWGNAFPKLQDALTVSTAGDEIWVAAGAYYPDEGAGQTNDSRTSTFRLKSGVAVYGGFAGAETTRSQRDPSVNVTVLSGDIGALGAAADNAYQVVNIIGSLADVYVLDGFTVTGGNSNGSSGHGGGIYIQNASPEHYLSDDDLRAAADYLKLPTSFVHGVATFYTMYSLKPRGKNLIRVCQSPPCHLLGSSTISRELIRLLGIGFGAQLLSGRRAADAQIGAAGLGQGLQNSHLQLNMEQPHLPWSDQLSRNLLLDSRCHL